MIPVPRLLLCLLCAHVSALHAGTYIESRDADDVRQRLYIDGPMVRIESDDADEYVIIDLKKRSYLSVNDAEQQIVDMSTLLRKKEMPERKSNIQFIKQGAGPLVAGFATARYKIVFKDTHCFDELLSQDALKLPDVKRYYETTQQFDLHGDEVIPSSEQPDIEDVCAQAAELLNQTHYTTLGVPMAAFDAQGELEHEVVQIVSGIAYPAETFELPGYETMSIADLMRQSAKDLLRDDALSEPPSHAPPQ